MSVPAEGPPQAQLMLVGESPGDEELKQGRPFVGPAGKLLDGMLDEAGIDRARCYITNVVNEQPNPTGRTAEERNEFSCLYEDKGKKRPTTRLQDQVHRLWQEIDTVRPRVIGALGVEPLRWLTGKVGQSITDWRGSVLLALGGENGEVIGGEGGGGQAPKVIPTYHPAAIGRMWKWRPISVFDYKRMSAEMAFPEVRRAPRRAEVIRTLNGALEALQTLKQGPPVAFDIEVETQQISSLALAGSAQEAVVFPIWWGHEGSYWAPKEEQILWEAVADLFATHPTIGQNVHYDLTFLKDYEVRARQLYMDTMVAFHVLYPELPKALEFMCSIYTDVPYYKWMRTTQESEEFWRYNGLDALVTWECAQAIEAELKETV